MADKDDDPRPLVCVDLDGVLNTFDGWKGEQFFHPPREGAAEFLENLEKAGFRIGIFTIRYHEWVDKWLEENGLAKYISVITDRKIPAHVYLDDHAVCFTGDYDEALKNIIKFRAHWSTDSIRE